MEVEVKAIQTTGSDPKVLFVFPDHWEDSPPLLLRTRLHLYGVCVRSKLNSCREFSRYELGTGAHGFYGSSHFAALFQSGRLFRRGKKIVSLEDMKITLKGCENESRSR